jgi:hypothetical protein
MRGVGVGCEGDFAGCDGASWGLDFPLAVFCCREALGGCEGLQVEGPLEFTFRGGHEQIFQEVGDEFVRPDTSGDICHYGSQGFGVVIRGELLLVGDEFHELAEFGGGFLHDGDVLFRLLEFGLAVDSADAGLSYPFAVDVGGFDLVCEGVPVG